MSLSSRKSWGYRFARFCYICFCILAAAFCGIFSRVFTWQVDWTVLCLLMACFMPVLCLLDIATLLAVAWSKIKAKELHCQHACYQEGNKQGTEIASLFLFHLLNLLFALVLLIIPAHSIWFGELTLVNLRALLVCTSSLSFFLALQLPYTLYAFMRPLLNTPYPQTDANSQIRNI